MLDLFIRLQKPFPAFFLKSNREELPTSSIIFKNLLKVFLKKAEENNFNNIAVYKGVKIIFYKFLGLLPYCDFKFYLDDEHFKKLFQRKAREIALNSLLGLKFLRELEMDDKIYNYFMDLLGRKKDGVEKFKKDIKEEFLRYNYEKSKINDLINLTYNNVLFSFNREFKIGLNIEGNNVSLDKQDNYESLKILLVFSFYPLFDIPESSILELVKFYLKIPGELEDFTNNLKEIVDNVANIIIYNLNKDDLKAKKLKEDAEINLIKLLKI